MELKKFSTHQEKTVRERAEKVRRYLDLRPDKDCEKLARGQLATIKGLEGVSLEEFLGEVFNPGSFENS